jgi:hypothetical protein
MDKARSAEEAHANVGNGRTFRIIGRVRNPLVFDMKTLCSMEVEEVEDLPIICGDGTPKGRIASCKGVLFEQVLRRAEVVSEEDNDTKKMFIIARASDGYSVVFSWQEIFNTAVGGGVMILTEKDGLPFHDERDRFELISAHDYHTGSRYVKNLETIDLVLAG